MNGGALPKWAPQVQWGTFQTFEQKLLRHSDSCCLKVSWLPVENRLWGEVEARALTGVPLEGMKAAGCRDGGEGKAGQSRGISGVGWQDLLSSKGKSLADLDLGWEVVHFL